MLASVLAAAAPPNPGPPEPSAPPKAPASSGGRSSLGAAAADALQREIDRTLEAHKWAEALPLIDRYLAEVARDPIMLYNAACCHAQLGAKDAAAKALLEAVKAGFRDFDTMEADVDLEPIRQHDTFTAILEARDVLRRGGTPSTPGIVGQPASPAAPITVIAGEAISACPQLDEWKRRHGEKNYRFLSDPVRRIHYATCLDPEAQAELVALIEREADHLSKTLFDGMPPYDTLIAVPTARDAKRYFADPTTTGIYEHRTRSLVAKDTGESLQHEFVHLMHFGHMERLHQKHPMWMQEGLASLYESFELATDGSVRFFPNTRHNLARRAALAGSSMPWRGLFALSPQTFMDKAQSLYPQVRSIFEFLADRGKLQQFYRTFVKTYRDDPTGALAMEQIFGRTLADVERSWKEWIKDRGAIDDTVSAGDASLGVTVTDAPDGVRIRETLTRSAARAGGMRTGDIMVAIEGKPIRSTRELALAVAARKVGETITVRYRREGEYREASVTLRPLGAVAPRP